MSLSPNCCGLWDAKMKISASRLLWSRDKEGGRLRHIAKLHSNGQTVASVVRWSDGMWTIYFVDRLFDVYGNLREVKRKAERELFGDA